MWGDSNLYIVLSHIYLFGFEGAKMNDKLTESTQHISRRVTCRPSTCSVKYDIYTLSHMTQDCTLCYLKNICLAFKLALKGFIFFTSLFLHLSRLTYVCSCLVKASCYIRSMASMSYIWDLLTLIRWWKLNISKISW